MLIPAVKQQLPHLHGPCATSKKSVRPTNMNDITLLLEHLTLQSCYELTRTASRRQQYQNTRACKLLLEEHFNALEK